MKSILVTLSLIAFQFGACAPRKANTYLTTVLSPQSIATRPKKSLKINDKFTYFTFDADQVKYGLGSSDMIKGLSATAPMFTVAADNVIYRQDTDSVAFIRRGVKGKDGKPIPYGGHLAFPAGFFDMSDASNAPSGQDFINNQNLIDKMKKGAIRELDEEAPGLGDIVRKEKSEFKGFASNVNRDIRYKDMPDYLPTTSAVFLTKLKAGPTTDIQGADDAAGHKLVWVPRNMLLMVAAEYSPRVHTQTFKAIDKKYTDKTAFTVEDFAFDHLKIAQSVLAFKGAIM
jgi:ADP-ribose pyrophosphatase YjhB (NUDIX family)